VDEDEVFENYLKGEGLKMTDPRRTVLEAFLGIERHVSAEGLYDAVRKGDPGIGQATVFRTVKLLVAAGIAREAGTSGGMRQYEHAFRHPHHDHLICERCGKLVEFESQPLEKAQNAVYAANGYSPTGHRLELFGVCPACAKRGAKKAG
jgi:Fur family transcriptional regulator, ferric uptake regulator